MKPIRLMIALSLALLPGAATGQPGSPPKPPEKPAPQPPKAVDPRGMEEDIEIMRRIIGRALVSRSSVASQCASCHGTGDGGVHWAQPPSKAFHEANFDFSFPSAEGAGPGGGGGMLMVAGHAHHGSIPLVIEGSYLSGHGVLYHLSLPSVGRDELQPAAAAEAPLKPASEWEQVRRELHGQPPATSTTAKRITLLDSLLQVIAENGKNLRQLPAGENVTIIATFRPPAITQTGAAGGAMSSGAGSAAGGMPPGAPMGSAGASPPGGGGGAAPGLPMTQDRELELLGDLHAKRGSWTEAAAAYERALAKVSDINLSSEVEWRQVNAATERAKARFAELMRKLVDTYLRRGDVDGARKALDSRTFKAYLRQSDTTDAKSAKRNLNLPGKLTITVSKQLVEKVGSGALPFAEFRKQVSWMGSGIDGKK